jgi:hypothetical protein
LATLLDQGSLGFKDFGDFEQREPESNEVAAANRLFEPRTQNNNPLSAGRVSISPHEVR